MEAHERVLHELLKMGEMLLGCGAEINRVEDTMTRLGRAYGAKRVDIFVITSDIVLTVLCFLCCSCINFFGLITGIIGIVSSSQVRKAVAAGDLALADQKSRTAKAMMIATAVIFGLAVIMSIILVATGALQGAMDELVYGSWY